MINGIAETADSGLRRLKIKNPADVENLRKKRVQQKKNKKLANGGGVVFISNEDDDESDLSDDSVMDLQQNFFSGAIDIQENEKSAKDKKNEKFMQNSDNMIVS